MAGIEQANRQMLLNNESAGLRVSHCKERKNDGRWRGGSLIIICIAVIAVRSAAEDSCRLLPVRPVDGDTVPDTRSADHPFILHEADASIPDPTILEWRSEECPDTARFWLYLAEESLVDDPVLHVRDTGTNSLEVWNLKIGTRYCWKVTAGESDSAVSSPVCSFFTPDLWPRMLFIEGITNVRDIGGRCNRYGQYIRQGLFYRSSEMSPGQAITGYGIRQLLDLGIVTEIDLRNDDETPDAVLPPEIRYFRPFDEEGGVEEFWYGLEHFSAQYAEVFRELAKRETFPAVCHCQAGADRTGTVTALLEAFLGCTREQIALNFQWSSLSVFGLRDTLIDGWKKMIAGLEAYDTADGTLEKGAWKYLVAAGVSPAELDSLRTFFLEGEPHGIGENGRISSVRSRFFTCGDAVRVNPFSFLSYGCMSHSDGTRLLYDLSGRIRKRYSGRNMLYILKSSDLR